MSLRLPPVRRLVPTLTGVAAPRPLAATCSTTHRLAALPAVVVRASGARRAFSEGGVRRSDTLQVVLYARPVAMLPLLMLPETNGESHVCVGTNSIATRLKTTLRSPSTSRR